MTNQDRIAQLEKEVEELCELKDKVLLLWTAKATEVADKRCKACQHFAGHCSASQWTGKHNEYLDDKACVLFFERPRLF